MLAARVGCGTVGMGAISLPRQTRMSPNTQKSKVSATATSCGPHRVRRLFRHIMNQPILAHKLLASTHRGSLNRPLSNKKPRIYTSNTVHTTRYHSRDPIRPPATSPCPVISPSTTRRLRSLKFITPPHEPSWPKPMPPVGPERTRDQPYIRRLGW